jgi:hypothetical protein
VLLHFVLFVSCSHYFLLLFISFFLIMFTFYYFSSPLQEGQKMNETP